MTDRLGDILDEGGRPGLRYERLLRHAPQTVWRALTESEHLAAWFPADIEGERAAGAAVTMRFWPALVARYAIPQPVTSGRILTWDPPREFAFDWGGDLVRFSLTAVDDGRPGTRLVLVVLLGEQSAATGTHRTAAGWHVCLDCLTTHLDDGTADGVVAADPAPLERRYERAFALQA